MRTLLSLLLIISLTQIIPAQELPLGSEIPFYKLKMPEIGGKDRSLKDLEGKEGLVVVFSCNTCPWVRLWEDRLVALAEKYQPEKIGFVAVNSNEAYRDNGDSFKDMEVYARANGYNFPYLLDKNSVLAKAFGATRTPQVFLFNKKGKLVYRGAIDDNAKRPGKVRERYLEEALEALLTDKPILTASTKSLGCTIKFATEEDATE